MCKTSGYDAGSIIYYFISGGTIVTSQRLVLCVPDDVADDSCLVCKEGV